MKTTFYINITMPDGAPIDDVEVVVDYNAVYVPVSFGDPYSHMTLNSVGIGGEYLDNDDQPIDNLAVHIQVLAKYQDKLEEKCWAHYREGR